MALHFFNIDKGGGVSSVTSGTSASFAYAKDLQITWDSTEITTKLSLLEHVVKIEDFLSKDDITVQTNAKPIGYRITSGGDEADVNFRNHVSGDTNSILDVAGEVAIEGNFFEDENDLKTNLTDMLENLKSAIIQSDFPIG